MRPEQYDLTPQQLNVYEVFQRNRRAWAMLIVALALFSIGFLAFVGLVVHDRNLDLAKGFIALFNLGIGTTVHGIVKHMYPSKGERGIIETIFGTRYTGRAPDGPGST